MAQRKPKPPPAVADFRAALAADFDAYGADAVARLRADDPIAYLRLCGETFAQTMAAPADDAALIAKVRALLTELGEAARDDG